MQTPVMTQVIRDEISQASITQYSQYEIISRSFAGKKNSIKIYEIVYLIC